MIFVSVTRLRVKSMFYLVPFFLANEASVKRLIRTPGFLGGRELIDKHLTFWTATLWETERNMREFRNSSAHREAMQKLPSWCDEASYVHWQQEERSLAPWPELYARMQSDGKLTKVRQPSPQQLSRAYPPIQWTRLGRTFKGNDPVNSQ
jgi:heme-degrading monooxygenase HmoA